jgi:DNA-binding transcriptional regulator YiaG
MSCVVCGGNLFYGCTCKPLAPPKCCLCSQPIQGYCCWVNTDDGTQEAHPECIRGEHLREVRLRLGLTQGTLATLLGVHGGTISNWETGKASPNSWCLGLLSVFATIPEPKAVGSRAASLIYSDGLPRALYELLRRSVVSFRCDQEEDAEWRNGSERKCNHADTR